MHHHARKEGLHIICQAVSTRALDGLKSRFVLHDSMIHRRQRGSYGWDQVGPQADRAPWTTTL